MKNLKAKLRKNGGFTLIEMLIVVAIIAILIAISIPLIGTALEDAREATDAANERAALGLAMVEVMTKNSLGGTTIGTEATYTAAYKIENGKGALAATGTAGSAGFDYGKGTTAGSLKTSREKGFITVTYTVASADFTTGWTTP